MILVEERVAQLVVFIGEFNGGLLEHNAFLHAVVLGKGTGGDVADNDLQRHDGDLLYGGLAVVELLHVVGGHALLLQAAHQVVGHAVVDGALAGDGALFQAVEGGGVVLVGDDDNLRVAGGVDLLGLALIELLLFLKTHLKFPPSEFFYLFQRLPVPSWP